MTQAHPNAARIVRDFQAWAETANQAPTPCGCGAKRAEPHTAGCLAQRELAL
jgi:hypothetical protein